METIQGLQYALGSKSMYLVIHLFEPQGNNLLIYDMDVMSLTTANLSCEFSLNNDGLNCLQSIL